MHRAFRRYVAIIGVLAAVYFIPVTIVNLAIDPMAQFRAFSLDAFDGNRQYASRTAKAAMIRHGDVDVAILGSSRPLAALDPAHEAFAGLHACNLALPGTNIFEQWDLFQYLMEHNTPKYVLACIDFAFFDGDRGGFDDFEKSMLNPKQSLTESWAECLWSTYALEKSWDVFSKYRAGAAPNYSATGLRLSHSDASWEDRFRVVLNQAARVSYLFPPPAYSPERIEILRQMVDLAKAKGSEVRMAILPMHATMLELMIQAGQWPMIEQWMRDVVAVLDGTGTPVWDFTGFTARHTEPIPGSSGEMKWFTDPSHCSLAYGDLVLRTLFEMPLPAEDQADPPGVLLRPDMLSGHFRRIEGAREAYLENAKVDVAFVSDIRAEVIADCERHGWKPRVAAP